MPTPAVQVKVKGVDELVVGSEQLAKNVEAEANKAFVNVAKQAADVARRRVPKVTGRLAASVKARKRGEGSRLTMGAGVPYAGWIEFGGDKPHPRPVVSNGRFIYPTALEFLPVAKNAATAATADTIRSQSWPSPK